MASIVWDQAGQRYYETGISKGVFYKDDGAGIPWNGLISVEKESTTDLDPLYFDGVKYGDVVSLGDFTGVLKAYTYPDEFDLYQGVGSWQAGFMVDDQPPRRFGLCYRTEIGNDQSAEAGYKLHIVYNILAIPDTVVYETMSLETEPSEFSWELSAMPEEVDNFRPTAHVIIDSRQVDPYLLGDVENILYGSDEEDTDPFLPSLASLIGFVQNWGRLIVTDHGDGTWTAFSPVPGVITMLDETTFEINAEEAEVIDVDTYTLSSSPFDSGELWQ